MSCKLIISTLSIIILNISGFPQSSFHRYSNNFSGTLPITLGGELTYGQTDYKHARVGFGAIAIGEYFFPTQTSFFFGPRVAFGGHTIDGYDNAKYPSEYRTDVVSLGAGIVAGYSFKDRYYPYIFAGISNLWFGPKDLDGNSLKNSIDGIYSKNTYSYDGEFGVRIHLSQKFSLLSGICLHFTQTDYLDDISAGNYRDFYFSAKVGITFALFGKKDSDGDGYPDTEDHCPDNAEDFDGFQDEDGCPELDNDKDKIVDVNDKCPNEKEDLDGFQDEDGCPDYDNDNDGIPDSQDKCPNVPENLNGFEDEDGCPDILSSFQTSNDRDGDGISNDVDKCPDNAETLNGFQDEDGCPDSLSSNLVSDADTFAAKEIVIEGNILFDFRGTELKPTAYSELDKLVLILEKDPFIKWMIESYTDNNGDLDTLKSLSKQRAISVVRYLIDKGLPSFMFRVYGKGSESPIADNKMLEGRIKNNRIVLRKSE